MLGLSVIAGAVPAAGDPAPDLPPSLVGVQFVGDPDLTNMIFNDYDFDGDTPLDGCDPEGTSTIAFTVTGLVSGAYPGTYTETALIELGPQAPRGGASQPGILEGAVTGFEASFTIDSEAGQVSGTKGFVSDTGGSSTLNVGSCFTATAEDGEDFSYPHLLDFVWEQRAAWVLASYSAIIVTDDGEFQDGGSANARFGEGGFTGICAPDTTSCTEGRTIANFFYINNGFRQVFTSSDGVEPVDQGGDPDPLPVPGSTAECKQGGWQELADGGGAPFRNQGECVSWVASAGKARPNR